mmetsp:Transcript_1300/g.3899  ORF Transcript_1300/g.3899 Transcript_1300/m.3899 type:complete len:202 (-) Transcript_1300:722-1327(-)
MQCLAEGRCLAVGSSSSPLLAWRRSLTPQLWVHGRMIAIASAGQTWRRRRPTALSHSAPLRVPARRAWAPRGARRRTSCAIWRAKSLRRTRVGRCAALTGRRGAREGQAPLHTSALHTPAPRAARLPHRGSAAYRPSGPCRRSCRATAPCAAPRRRASPLPRRTAPLHQPRARRRPGRASRGANLRAAAAVCRAACRFRPR